MRVLVACESSGVVRRAFEERGHDAWSCDLLPADDGGAHFQGDALLVAREGGWDLVIAHPPCQYLTSSAACAFGDGPYHQKVKPGTLVGAARRAAREEALDFVRALMAVDVPRLAIENPAGAIGTRIRKADQYIQPWEFGSDASKRTGLWLKGLPLLRPTQYIAPRMVNGRPRWANQTDSGQNRLSPSDDRWQVRSRTYPGIASAMAEQWGGLHDEQATRRSS